MQMTDDVTVRDPAVQELLDKQAVREAVMRYCRGVDRCDPELVASAYHPDGLEDRPGTSYTGATIGPKIVGMLQEMMQSTNHQIGTQLIEVRGNTASAESYSTGRHVLKDGQRLHTLVRYADRFEKRDGEWKIIHRTVITDSTETLPPVEAAPLTPSRARRDKSDPSYTIFQR
jgi:ketosteroid isomerase-like protein